MSSNPASPVRVGLIGVGGICAFVHYPGLERIPGVEIAALADPNPNLLAQRQREWEVDHIYQDAGQMLAEIKPDAVVIATHERDISRIATRVVTLCDGTLAQSSPSSR